MDYSKFDKMVDLDGLRKDIEEVEKNGGGDFKEVPKGSYEVRVQKLELTTSSKDDPMVSCWFKIIAGEYKGSLIFYNQVVTKPFQFHMMNQFLRSLESEQEVKFESYRQYAELLMDILEDIDGNTEYVLEYGENSKGYNTFKITDVFDVE